MNDTQILELDLRQVVGFLRRRLRLIGATMLVVMLLVGVVAFSLPAVYSASTMIMVDPARRALLDPQAQFAPGTSESARIDSEVQLILSDTNLLEVIAQERLLGDPEFGVRLGLRDQLLSVLRIREASLPTGRAALAEVLTQLRAAVRANRIAATYLIAVEVRSRSPERAAELANVIAQSYVIGQVRARIDSALQARDVLEARMVAASEAVAASEDAFDTFLDQNLEMIVSETGRLDLAELRRSMLDREQQAFLLSERVSAADASILERDFSRLATTLESEAVRILVEQRRQIESALLVADEEAAAVDLRAELARIEEELTEAGQTELSRLRQTVAETQSGITTLRQDLRSQVLRADLPNEVVTRIYEIQQTAELARSQYQTLLARLMDLEAQASLQIADSRIVSEAIAPDRPVFPNTRLLLVISAAASLMMGVGLAFLYENYIGGITNPQQFEAVLNVPLVAAVPRQRQPRDLPMSGLADLMVNAPLSPFAEAVRTVKMSIDQHERRHAQASNSLAGVVVAVTSTNPGEGKTTMALSVARAFALSGFSTLLIDGDLRKPGLHGALGRPPSGKLVDALDGNGVRPVLDELVERDEASSLYVVLGGRRADLPIDQLMSGSGLERLIREAAANFQVVIVDTAPIAPVADSMYLVSLANYVVFLVRAGVTPQHEISETLDKIRNYCKDDAVIMGVLNNYLRNGLRDKGEYAGYYESYE